MDYGCVRKEIGELIQRDQLKLDKIEDCIRKSAQNTVAINQILQNFDARIEALQQTILPFHKDTSVLYKRQEDIANTLSSIHQVKTFLNVCQTLEPIIHSGPKDGIDKYLQAMAKLDEAKAFLDRNIPTAPELADMNELYKDGRYQIEQEFVNIIQQSRINQQISDEKLANAVLADDSQLDELQQMHFLHPDDIAKLSLLSDWLAQQSSDKFIQHYLKHRSEKFCQTFLEVKKRIRRFVQHQAGVDVALPGSARSSRQSSHSLEPAHRSSGTGSMGLAGAAAASGRRLIPFKGVAFRSTALLLGSAAPKPAAPGGTFADAAPKDDCEIELAIIGYDCHALLVIGQLEKKLLDACLRADATRYSGRPLLHDIFKPAVIDDSASLIADGQALCTICERVLSKRDFRVVVFMVAFLLYFAGISNAFFQLFSGGEMRDRLIKLIESFASVAKSGLDNLLDAIKRPEVDKKASVPPDGTVHEYTTHILTFMSALADYRVIIGVVLSSDGQVVNRLTALHDDARADSKQDVEFARYLKLVVAALGLNLYHKSAQYNDPTLKAVFLMNNYNYIMNKLTELELLRLITSTDKGETERHLNEKIYENEKAYQQSLMLMLNNIFDESSRVATSIPSPAEQVKAREKERQAVKDRFSNFNKELERFCNVQRDYVVPDRQLREKLKKDNCDTILRPYKMFRAKHEHSDFTKKPEKYLKYTVEDVRDKLNSIFSEPGH